MTFQGLCKANEGLKTVDIKGKQYTQVNERIKAFRMLYPEGTISTEVLQLSDGFVMMKAAIIVNGILVATGHAYEREGTSNINKTSYIENCETSAVGRALAFMGFGIDLSIASAEEVDNAIEQQSTELTITDIMAKTIVDLAEEKGIELQKILDRYKAKELKDIKAKNYQAIMTALKKSKGKA